MARREAATHTRGWVDARREGTSRFYAEHVTESTWTYFQTLLGDFSGKRVLDYGCGTGEGFARIVAAGARRVVGVDIAADMIQEAKERIAQASLSGKVEARVMDSHALQFPDDSFDVVVGISILHHLDLKSACREVARVLAPKGWAVFVEPLGLNPFINWYRRRTPEYRSPDERPLVFSDFRTMERYFRVQSRFFAFSVLLSALPGLRWLASPLRAVDAVLLRIPGLRLLAWTVVLKCELRETSRSELQQHEMRDSELR